MRHLITRTVKSYVTPVTLVTINNEGGIVGSEQLENHVSFSKVAESTIRKAYKDKVELKENQSLLIGETKKKEQTLAIPTEFFVANAKPLEAYKED